MEVHGFVGIFMADFYWYILGALWLIGAISEIAKINSKIYRHNIEKPYYGAFLAVWVLLFFTWPYWYFYDK